MNQIDILVAAGITPGKAIELMINWNANKGIKDNE
jgi:hypothetical protein